MALNTFKCNYLTPLHLKGLKRSCVKHGKCGKVLTDSVIMVRYCRQTGEDEWNDSSIETQLAGGHFITSNDNDGTPWPIRRRPLRAPGPHTARAMIAHVFTVRLHVMQRTVLLSQFFLSV